MAHIGREQASDRHGADDEEDIREEHGEERDDEERDEAQHKDETDDEEDEDEGDGREGGEFAAVASLSSRLISCSIYCSSSSVILDEVRGMI